MPDGADQAESFYARALVRISRCMVVLAVGISILVWVFWGFQKAAGFAAGAAISYLNFAWLKRAVVALSDRIIQAGDSKRGGGGVVAKFLLRYLVAAVAAFLLYRFSPATMPGFFAGLFLPVAAILCEAAFEAYVAVVRGT